MHPNMIRFRRRLARRLRRYSHRLIRRIDIPPTADEYLKAGIWVCTHKAQRINLESIWCSCASEAPPVYQPKLPYCPDCGGRRPIDMGSKMR
jgi:hypothetical protein